MTPKRIVALTDERAVVVAAGGAHSMVATDGGKLYTFGWGGYGRLGHGEDITGSQLTPKLVEGLKDEWVVDVATGDYYSMAVTDSGQLYTFGRNASGELGHGDTQQQHTPKLVAAHVGGERDEPPPVLRCVQPHLKIQLSGVDV